VLTIGEHHRLVTALFASGVIFLTYTVIPWLDERMKKDLYRLPSNDYQEGKDLSSNNKEVEAVKDGVQQSPLDRALKLLLLNQKLTPRETEITVLLLKGLTNREITAQLCISKNTLKTYLHNFYQKYGGTLKRELLSLVLNKKTYAPAAGKATPLNVNR